MLKNGKPYNSNAPRSTSSDDSDSTPPKRNQKKPTVARKKPAIKKPSDNRAKSPSLSLAPQNRLTLIGPNDPNDPNDLHEVRCCSDTNLGSGWKQHPNCIAAGFTNVWGESDINGVCNSAKTLVEAVDVCDAVGARLCSKEELLADCPRGTGKSILVIDP